MLLFGTIALQNCGNDVILQSYNAKDSHGEGRNIQENASSGWARPSDDRGDGGPSAVSVSDRDTVVGRPASEAHQSAEVSAHATPRSIAIWWFVRYWNACAAASQSAICTSF